MCSNYDKEYINLFLKTFKKRKKKKKEKLLLRKTFSRFVARKFYFQKYKIFQKRLFYFLSSESDFMKYKKFLRVSVS